MRKPKSFLTFRVSKKIFAEVQRKKKRKSVFGYSFLLIVFSVVGYANAQTSPGDNPSVTQETPPSFETFSPEQKQRAVNALQNSPGFSLNSALPQDAVNCFDYYNFNSLRVDIVPHIDPVISGTSMDFSGEIINGNDYPIVDASVYVKIFHKQADEKNGSVNAHDIIDQFFVVDNLSLTAKGQQSLDFTWKVPAGAVTGDYFASFYVVSQNKFNLLGLPYLDDVVGSVTPFQIRGEKKNTVSFDKNTVTLNAKPNHFTAPHLQFDANEPVVVKVKLSNPTKDAVSAFLHWTLFQGDNLAKENQLKEKAEAVDLKPGETKELSYTVTDTQYPIYYLVAQADFEDTHSFLDIRFMRKGVNKFLINFPAVTSYPLEAGKQSTLFACLHNSGTDTLIKNGQLDLSVTDAKGAIIDSYTYQGDVTGGVMGIKHDFTPKESVNTFTVSAKLYQKGKLVDEATMKYDCQALGIASCQQSAPLESSQNTNTSTSTWRSLLFLFAVIIFAVFIGGWAWFRMHPSSRR